MSRHVRSEDEVRDAFKEQMLAISASSKSYDEGHLWEARRLATAAYTLLHDGTGRTKSILTQLKARAKLIFYSSARPLDPSLLPSIALINMKTSGGPWTFSAPLDGVREAPWLHEMQFPNWYEEPIFKMLNGNVLTRKNLIFALRSQDGGSHFDGELPDNAYYYFATENDPRVRLVDGDVERPMPNAHLASMRQIAWEISESVKPLL